MAEKVAQNNDTMSRKANAQESPHVMVRSPMKENRLNLEKYIRPPTLQNTIQDPWLSKGIQRQTHE